MKEFVDLTSQEQPGSGPRGSTAEHTPGPWKIARSGNGYPYQITAPNGNRGPGGIRSVTRWGAITMPGSREGEANARLIAAAPDLLEAAKSLRLVLRLAAWKYGFDLTDSAAMEEADAALAKALPPQPHDQQVQGAHPISEEEA